MHEVVEEIGIDESRHAVEFVTGGHREGRGDDDPSDMGGNSSRGPVAAGTHCDFHTPPC